MNFKPSSIDFNSLPGPVNYAKKPSGMAKKIGGGAVPKVKASKPKASGRQSEADAGSMKNYNPQLGLSKVKFSRLTK